MNASLFVRRIFYLSATILIFSCSSIKQTVPNASIIEPSYRSIDSTTEATIPNASIIEPSYRSIDSTTEANVILTKDLLGELSLINPKIAKELGKLPDLHDGISSGEINAIEKLIELYNFVPADFEEFFARMENIGNPEVRKYLAPLEALLWLSQEDEIETLRKRLTYDTIGTLYGAQILLGNAWNFLDQAKWGDPHKVMDRLNSPELFEYWFAHNFKYDWSKFWITAPRAYPQSAETSIKIKKGICFDAAYLAYVCLKRAGYDVTGLNVYFVGRAPSRAIMHSVCILKKEEFNEIKFYKLGDTNTPGRIVGPYDSIQKVAEDIASMHGVHLKRYVTGVPHYDYGLW